MSVFKDRVGELFGRLKVANFAGMNHRKEATWECVCSCGNSVTVSAASLVTGNTRSCGCLRIETDHKSKRGRESNLFRHGLSRSPTYRSWMSMRMRCSNPTVNGYSRYGGRGISVCLRWQRSFLAFLADMGIRPKGKTIDRWPNKDGNYTPSNCRWATAKEQAANRNRRIR